MDASSIIGLHSWIYKDYIHLDLGYNNLKSIYDIEYIKKTIRTLILEYNELESMKGIMRLSYLELLNLSYNKI